MADIKIELVAYNLQSLQAAVKAGVDRIELCSSPDEGGVTPSFGFIEQARKLCPMDLYVMIRPRGGDFLYNIYEYNAMKRDIAQSQRLSIDGVVLGILKADGSLDKTPCKELIDMARPLKVTCHRAFDMTADPFQALEDCIEIGFDRILTSGQKSNAIEGQILIADLIKRAAGRINIMPGAGINANNVVELLKQTQAKEIHLSAKTHVASQMQFINEYIKGMGASANEAYQILSADVEMLQEVRRLLQAI